MDNLVEMVTKRRALLLTLLALVVPLGIVIAAVQRNEGAEPVEITTEKWTKSGHADFSSQAFTFWGEGSGVIPANCATCHSAHGLLDYVGERGSVWWLLNASIAPVLVFSFNSRNHFLTS